MFFLFLFIFIFNIKVSYSNEILNDENIFEFVETDNELLNFYRKNFKELKVSTEEINLYNKKLKFFGDFFEKKINLKEEDLKKRIILIKENLLN